jgi:hypothetical protein
MNHDYFSYLALIGLFKLDFERKAENAKAETANEDFFESGFTFFKLASRVARFFLVQDTNTRENVPNCNKI